jgi:hypothetical protein
VKALTCSFFGSAIFLAGCGVAHDAVVTSFKVATAPIRFVDRQIDKPPQKQQPVSDVTNPGRPVATASPSKQQRPAHANSSSSHSSKKPEKPVTSKTAAQAKPSPSPKGATATMQFPTAKTVPGKPGYVFSPSDPNKYVDVSGFAPGSKVKDPYSGKIFLVP